MRVVSIDPAIRNTGYAVIEGDYRAPRALDSPKSDRSLYLN